MTQVPSMYWSKSFIPTLKETPQEAQIKSHRLMLRAGLIRKLASGTYSYLPLGLRALKKAEAIVRQEMDRAGALEVFLPALHPADLWRETGRYDILGEDMLRFKDRHGKENVLGPTHEEIITDLARREIHSYKQLPLTLYQIQTKFRDEMRPRSGVIRSREFIMKDAYSFHATEACLDRTYHAMQEAYQRIFTRCGLEFFIVQADPGAMGGSGSQEFVLFSDAGEDRMVQVGDSEVVMSVEMAERKLRGLSRRTGEKGSCLEAHTPAQSSGESLTSFAAAHGLKILKTMIYTAKEKKIAVLVLGDHEVSEYKVKKHFPEAVLAGRDTIDGLGSAFGFSGPINLNVDAMLIDEDVLLHERFLVGANRRDYHLTDVRQGDFPRNAVLGDFRQATDGDESPGGEKLHFKTAIELGHIFKLNLRYSQPMKANVLDALGKEKPIVMGCYGIGLNRILAAAIEQNGDEKGIVWPKNISPYQVEVVLMDPKDAQSQEIVSQLAHSKELMNAGVDLLIDDREDSAGRKFNDADLIGIPLRLILGPKNLKNGKAEIKDRKTGQATLVDIPNTAQEILARLDKIT